MAETNHTEDSDRNEALAAALDEWVPVVVIDAGKQRGMDTGKAIRLSAVATEKEAWEIAYDAFVSRGDAVAFTVKATT